MLLATVTDVWLLLICCVRLQSCCEELTLKTAELSRQQEIVVDLQSQLSSQNQHLRFVCYFYVNTFHPITADSIKALQFAILV